MIYVETNENKAINVNLLYPHLSWHKHADFKKGQQTVFLREGYDIIRLYTTFGSYVRDTVGVEGVEVEGVEYIDIDHISWKYSQDERTAAWKAAEKKIKEELSAAFIQEYLRILYGEPTLLLLHIKSGVNCDGYGYWLYGYIFE